jgi:hypothetical protein
MRSKREVLAFVITGLLFGAGCAVEGADGEETDPLSDTAGLPDTPPVFLDQGWTPQVRDAFYWTSQGSRMIPYKWWLVLEQANSRALFKLPANMRRMGFLVDGISAANPDENPVGFARDVDPTKGDALGLTCAACHTGEVKVGTTALRIDGGQGFSDLEALQDGLLASLTATYNDSQKFSRFATNVLGSGATTSAKTALKAELAKYRDWWSRRIARSRGLSPHGPSRIDAFTIIGNEVVCELLQIPSNCAPGIAPTQFPFLWNTPDLEWVQWNSSVHSPIGRNVGEVTGVFAEGRLDPTWGMVSSANVVNLDKLENWLKPLRSPKWPAEYLGPINEELAAQGAAIYAGACASCHTLDPQPRTAPNAYGLTFAKVDFSTPLSALGTDPTMALTFATRRADPGPWLAIAQSRGVVGEDGKAPVASLLNIQGGMVLQRFFILNGLTDLQKLYYLGYREQRSATVAQLTTYKARPLNGIAFTAPYLHNGSVPSMWELLLPPAQRTKQFYVGSHQFDPVEVGFSTDWEQGALLLDTTLTGNGNGGHVYGTTLTDAERWALVEYMKTL